MMNIDIGFKVLRALLCLAFAALASLQGASAADAPAKIVRIGFLEVTEPGGPPLWVVHELAKLGYVEGKNLVVEYRGARNDQDRLAELAAELVKLNVDLIIAISNRAAVAAQKATRTIPIVAWGAHGALEIGLVNNLARPGGNLTGVESLAPELDSKRVEFLKQIVPALAQVAVLYDSGDQASPVHLKSTRRAAAALGVAVSTLEVQRDEDFGPVLQAAAGKPLGGVLIFTTGLTFLNIGRIMDFALVNRLPTACEFRELVQAGCLFSYGPNFIEFAQRNAAQIDKILKGTPPGDLPVEQMTRFELAINVKSAAALGVTIPKAMLMRANEIIQ
ncbi:ABC transporter substrate-binding protein [Variovorax sp. J22P240]|uniref:ABC transporter substrate-binding protein n=1 Tax=Variovorax sp. J22P240 TaxID=3053514 RepID=UPI0025769436|nr:ABC transporter substrate-binding protein [Variovorax sp. J22P240]MDM0001102.1 ABC transporter substrate-binding protein [Variovorax sp. J22P240]